jgi:uncharacterized membrane protein
MATLTVWKFDDPEGARATLGTLQDLRRQQLIQIVDAAIVTWPADKKRPTTRQLRNLTAEGALSGSFWGWLFGLLFLVPVLGLAVGAAAGALSGSLSDVGIDDRFVDKVRGEVTPGTSALFVLSRDAVADRVQDALAGTAMELIASNLSAEEEARLREIFEDDEDEEETS